MQYSVTSMRAVPEGYAWSRFGQPEYTDWLDESLSWKQTCYVGDWSFLWQHRITGPDALRLLSDFTVNSMASFVIGQSKHAIHTDDNGKVIHEGVLTRFGEDEFMVHGRGGFWLKFNAERGDYRAEVTRDDWFVLQVSGPESIKVLRKLDSSNRLLAAKYMHIVPINVAGHDIHALRQGRRGNSASSCRGRSSGRRRCTLRFLRPGRSSASAGWADGWLRSITSKRGTRRSPRTTYRRSSQTRSTSTTSWRRCRRSLCRHTSPAAFAASASRSITGARLSSAGVAS